MPPTALLLPEALHAALRECRNLPTPNAANRLYATLFPAEAASAVELCAIGNMLRNAAAPRLAVEFFQRALSQSPDMPQAMLGLADALVAADRPKEALEVYEDLVILTDPALAPLLSTPLSPPLVCKQGAESPAARDSPIAVRCFKAIGEIRAIEYPDITRTDAFALSEFIANSDSLLDFHPKRMLLTIRALGFSKASSVTWTETLFKQLLEPLLVRAHHDGAMELALMLETILHGDFVLQTETSAHFRSVFKNLLEPMRYGGHAFGSTLPTLHWPPTPVPVVGFVLHTPAVLAHTEVLLNYLDGLMAMAPSPIRAEVYILTGLPDGGILEKRLQHLHIPIIWIAEQIHGSQQPSSDRFLALRSVCVKRLVSAIVWISLVQYMVFAFAMRVAPVQIWWAMKYRSLEFAEIDGYVTGWSATLTKRLGNRIWRSGRLGVQSWSHADFSDQATRIRQRFAPQATILGSFGREEKLNNKEFLDTICRILRANPDAIFLWTGRQRLTSIETVFSQAGVEHQCVFIGWVNTMLYAQVIDIFMDSFPFPCGFTAVHAMAAGKPVVLFESEESYETGLHGIISPILNGTDGSRSEQETSRRIFFDAKGKSSYFCAKNALEYEVYVQALIDQPELRLSSGMACKTYVEKFFSDSQVMAASFTQHFLELIAQQKSKHPRLDTLSRSA